MIRSLRHCLVIVICLLIILAPPLARASMDPQSATVSATATIPSLITIDDEDAPTPPILIRPPNGSVSGDPRPEFVWTQSTDTGGNTVFYTLYLNGVATYLGISNAGNSAGTGYTARLEGGEVRLLPTQALGDGIYDWYVTASDLSGNASRSVTWRLTIDTSPPPLTIIDIENYHLPPITEGANFDIDGPKDVYFTILSDPFVTIELSLTPYALPYTAYSIRSTTNASGLAYPYQHLTPGVYTVLVTATDQGGNQTSLPTFTLTLTQATITITFPTIPGIPASPTTYSIPYTPYSLPSLPATISKIESRGRLPNIASILLAISIPLLLIILWRRRYNLLLLNNQGQPIRTAVVYHSLPDTKRSFTSVYLSRHAPISFDLLPRAQGRLYIPRLSRYSTLTVRTATQTYILSLSAQRDRYTLILG